MNVNTKDPGNGHFIVSLVKSILRLGASYTLFITGDFLLMTVGVLLGLAEVLGIIEELV